MLATTIQETRIYRDAKAEGRREGEQQERALVLRQLARKVGEICRPPSFPRCRG